MPRFAVVAARVSPLVSLAVAALTLVGQASAQQPRTIQPQLTQLFSSDSLEMTEADRDLVAHNCTDAPERHIVITHGTDTMVETARTLAAKVAGKTVVLTGAMIPIAFGSSDGLFNLGGAITAAQVLPPGVYITMNGRVFPWDRVRKNRSTGVFEEVE